MSPLKAVACVLLLSLALVAAKEQQGVKQKEQHGSPQQQQVVPAPEQQHQQGAKVDAKVVAEEKAQIEHQAKEIRTTEKSFVEMIKPGCDALKSKAFATFKANTGVSEENRALVEQTLQLHCTLGKEHTEFLHKLKSYKNMEASLLLPAFPQAVVAFLKTVRGPHGEYARLQALIPINRKKSPEFNEAFLALQKSNKKLANAFIAPVQRIPRYKLCVENLLKAARKAGFDQLTVSEVEIASQDLDNMAKVINSKVPTMNDAPLPSPQQPQQQQQQQATTQQRQPGRLERVVNSAKKHLTKLKSAFTSRPEEQDVAAADDDDEEVVDEDDEEGDDEDDQ